MPCLCSDDTLELSIMPKDEDILQLVSPALLSEVEGPGACGQDTALLGPPFYIGHFGRQRRV